jgi:hypothetical protein
MAIMAGLSSWNPAAFKQTHTAGGGLFQVDNAPLNGTLHITYDGMIQRHANGMLFDSNDIHRCDVRVVQAIEQGSGAGVGVAVLSLHRSNRMADDPLGSV